MIVNKGGIKKSESELLNLSQFVDWKYSSTNLNVQQMWEELHGKLMEMTSNIPITNIKTNVSINAPPHSLIWLSPFPLLNKSYILKFPKLLFLSSVNSS